MLEGFLLKETGAKTTIDMDVVAVGGNAMHTNRSRHLLAAQQRQDLKALCLSFHSLQLSDYMEFLIWFFDGD
jgi:carbamate kinase